jgi:ElaB/YqjD/DUF883 family membrane-anchored ribosome-binding protein
MNHDAQASTPGKGRHAASPNGTEHLSSGAGGAAREYHKLLSDLEDLIHSATTLTGEELARAKAALGARIASARASASQISDAVTDRVQASARATDQYVHSQPWQAVGISAAAGLLIGFLLGRRNS